MRILRSNGFVIEHLHPLYAPEGADDALYYDIVTPDWAGKWPAEDLWVARYAPDETSDRR